MADEEPRWKEGDKYEQVWCQDSPRHPSGDVQMGSTGEGSFENPQDVWSWVRDRESNSRWGMEVTSSQKSRGKGNRAGCWIRSSKARLVG